MKIITEYDELKIDSPYATGILYLITKHPELMKYLQLNHDPLCNRQACSCGFDAVAKGVPELEG